MTQEAMISAMIDWMVSHADQRPSLTTMARKAGYDPTYFQKTFKDYTGISPKQFIDFIAYRHARDFLIDQLPTLEAAHQAGLSGQGRLHDLFIRIEGVTPGSVSQRGNGLTIHYGWHPSPLGDMIIAQTDKGLCWAGFQLNHTRKASLSKLQKHWPNAQLREDTNITRPYAKAIITLWQGHKADALPLDLYGTNLQIQVWQALLRIPSGHSLSYQTIAQAIGKPRAARAIGNAVGANPISLLIPCHRVIRATGIVDNYAWGSARKKALLGLETALLD